MLVGAYERPKMHIGQRLGLHRLQKGLGVNIEVVNLACRRGRRIVFSGLNFRVRENQCLVIIGDNGTGKSTLLHCLAGLLRPAAGAVAADIDEMVLLGHRDAVTARMSTSEHLRFWADFYGTDAGGAIKKASDALGLAPLLDRAAYELSAGQRRRLGLARIIVSGRRNWLLDEPTTALDVPSQARFMEFLTMHLEDGGRAVVTGHSSGGMDEFPSVDLTAHGQSAPQGTPAAVDDFTPEEI